MNDTSWLSLDDAAKRLGLGRTTLYTLAQQGKIPASKLSKQWRFDPDMLDAWVASKTKTIDEFFIKTDSHIENNEALREPQREAYLRAYEFFKAEKGRTALVQMPVGCGKSGLAALLPFGIARGRVLVIAPNLEIKDEVFRSLDISNRQKCFWRKMNVLAEKDMLAGPYACTLDEGNISVCEKSHIVITNIQQLATNADKWLSQFSADFFDLIIVDEAHHSAAVSWKKVFDRFPKAKIVNMTATPFRSDQKEVEGELVYRYSFRSATLKGYIKNIKASYIAPIELTFTIDGEKKVFSREEVLRLKEEEWFSRGVALSPACNESIVDNSLQKLESLRLTGTRHQLIAVACSINHARQIRSLYASRNYTSEIIHSGMSEEEQDDVLAKLRNGTLDCIIQVQMLGEGFDHPLLSVAAIFRPFRSLAPYIQFVGRVLRVIVQNDPTHPDNYGYIVTHVGLNLDKMLEQFQQFERDDEAFWKDVIGGKEPTPPREVLSGEARMHVRETKIADSEIVESLIEEDFISPDDELLIRDLEKKFEQLGIDPAQARSVIMGNKRQAQTIVPAAQPFAIQPQKEWSELKTRLNEEVQSTARVLLNRTGLSSGGVEMIFKLSLGIQAANNFAGALTLVNSSLKKRNDKARNLWTTEEFKEAIKTLSVILEENVRKIKKAQSQTKV